MSLFRAITDFSAENEIRMLMMAAGSVDTPAAGYVNYFIDVADGVAKIKNSSGVVSELASFAGLDFKASVRLATATILPNTPTYSAGVLTADSNTTLTVDANVCALNDRVLVKNQVVEANNGIYYLSQLGSGAAPWKLTRALDFDDIAEIPGAMVAVEAGTANQDTVWLSNADQTAALGTDPIVFTQFLLTSVTLLKISDMAAVARTFCAAATVQAQLAALQPTPYAAGTLATPTAAVNYANGPVQAATMPAGNVSAFTISNGAAGAELELHLTGQASARDFTTALGLPSDSVLTWPKSITASKVYVIKFKYLAGAWKVVSLVGGY